MTTYIDRSNPNENIPIPETAPLIFSAEYILHCRYSFGFYVSESSRKIVFEQKIKTYAIGSNQTIEDFAVQLNNGKVNFTPIQDPPAYNGSQPTPFDIGVHRPCYVVFELDSACNWIFSQSQAAFTQKSSAYPGENGDVFHVRPSDGQGQTPPVMSEDCRIAYFSVFKRSDLNSRLFNCNVRFLESGYAIETIIDPDIKNTGTQPFP